MERLRALGNALVPQIAEWIGRRIVDYEQGRLAA
jgi:site-specific DNA-cytosine methylase